MSRSFKKEAIIKDKGFQKNEYNKRLRRKVKPLVKKASTVPNELTHPYEFQTDQIVDVVLPNTHEVTNDYDISDYRSRWDNLDVHRMTGREKRRIIGK